MRLGRAEYREREKESDAAESSLREEIVATASETAKIERQTLREVVFVVGLVNVVWLLVLLLR